MPAITSASGEDQVPGRDTVLVLGHDFWKRGLYAVVAYQVARRTREIVGLVLSFAAGRVLSANLGTPSLDALLFSVVAVGLLLTTLLAAAIPSHRAARVDPMQALRQD